MWPVRRRTRCLRCYLVLANYIRVHLTWPRTVRLTAGSAMLAVGAVWTVLSFYVQAVPGILH